MTYWLCFVLPFIFQSSPERESDFGSSSSLHLDAVSRGRASHLSTPTRSSLHGSRRHSARDSGYFSQCRTPSNPHAANVSLEESYDCHGPKEDTTETITQATGESAPQPFASDTLPKRYPKTREEVSVILEKATKYQPANIPMLAVQGYSPAQGRPLREETKVEAGMVVNALYKTRDWVFVRTPLEDAGFIPFTAVEHIGARKQGRDFSQQFPENNPVLPKVSESDHLPDKPGGRTDDLERNNSSSSDSSLSTSQQSSPELSCTSNLTESFTAAMSSQNLIQWCTPAHQYPLSGSSRGCAISREHLRASLPLGPHRLQTRSSSTSELRRNPYGGSVGSILNRCSATTQNTSELRPTARKDSPPHSSPDSYSSQHLRKQCSKLFGSVTLQALPNSNVGLGCNIDVGLDLDGGLCWTRDMPPEDPCDVRRRSVSSGSLHLSDLSDGRTGSWDSLCDILSDTRPAAVVVLFDFDAVDEHDVSVCQHDVVTLLCEEDPDWLWVRRHDGAEGFIPRAYASDLNALILDPSVKSTYL